VIVPAAVCVGAGRVVQVEFVDLTDEVDAKAVMRFFPDEPQAA
jgi:hypothetical protein